MIFYTLFLTEVLSLPWQLLHMHSIGSAQLFLLFVNEYLEDVICEFFDILKYLHVHIMPRLYYDILHIVLDRSFVTVLAAITHACSALVVQLEYPECCQMYNSSP